MRRIQNMIFIMKETRCLELIHFLNNSVTKAGEILEDDVFVVITDVVAVFVASMDVFHFFGQFCLFSQMVRGPCFGVQEFKIRY